MKIHIIYCIDCGRRREVQSQNWKQVKRCERCQYLLHRSYNSQHIKEKREKAKENTRIIQTPNEYHKELVAQEKYQEDTESISRINN